MHPNPAFRDPPRETNIAFARQHSFGVLAVNTDTAPLISHIPFLLSEDGTLAEFHLVRSNPIARMGSAPMQARLAVQGPNSYISPDWYWVEDQVPTWNYVAVHIVGEVETRPADELLDLIDRQSAHHESQLRPKSPWTSGKMTPDILERMMRQIVPCRMRVDEIHGTWKLNQNKPDEVRLRAAGHVERSGMGQEIRQLADLMRNPPE